MPSENGCGSAQNPSPPTPFRESHRRLRYYTDFNYPPVRQIAQASLTGHGTNVIAGMSVGMQATAAPSDSRTGRGEGRTRDAW